MQIPFYKYQGTGNDFVMIDNRPLQFPKNDTKLVTKMCDRNFGIGADGLILLESHPNLDFNMVYYNADGNLSSMCGNGGRCIAHFAKYLGMIQNNATFEAIDGIHEASIDDTIVKLRMGDVALVEVHKEYVFLDTGSPHHVQLVDSIDSLDVFSEGKKIRNNIYGTEGANVNFVKQIGDAIFSVRTYERGVEDETLSCGTGVTAVALAMYEMSKTEATKITLQTPGGNLKVYFEKTENGYQNVYLEGSAMQVFKGVWS
jgi:diaminopimelate epimerase